MDRFDVLMLVGGLAVATGFGLLSIPLGLIVGGGLCIALAVMGARANVHGNVATSGKEVLTQTPAARRFADTGSRKEAKE